MYARTNKCYNEGGSGTIYVRSSIPHCICIRLYILITYSRCTYSELITVSINLLLSLSLSPMHTIFKSLLTLPNSFVEHLSENNYFLRTPPVQNLCLIQNVIQ